MTFHQRPSISAAFLVAVTAIAGSAILVLGYLSLSEEYRRFATDSAELRQKFTDRQKELIRNEVEKVLDYIEYRHSKTEEVLRSSLKERTYEAHAIATGLVEAERGRRSRAELENLVREALRPIRFNNGRGYYFMVGMDGVEKLYPVAPQFENTNLLGLQDAKGNFVIRDEIALLQREQEGFVFDSWRKPDASDQMIYPKMTFVERFEPFGWYLGTGEYLDDYEHDLKEELLERIARVRYGREGYIFVNTFDGMPLITDGERVRQPTNLWELTDPNGVKVIQEERKACEKPEGDFINYTWRKLTTSDPAPKVSFVKAYAPWNWMVGAGVYLDEVEGELAQRRGELDRSVKRRVVGIAAIIAGIAVLLIVAANIFSRRTRHSFRAFSRFFQRAATESSTIDESQLHFSEFVDLARSANAMVEARRRSEEEKRDLEEQLLRSRKMEALGLLAGGVAHDLNNILSGLVMYPDLLLTELPPDSPHRARVAAIKDSGLRAAAVVADLQAASRGGRAATTVVNVNAVVEAFLRSPELEKLTRAHPDVALEHDLDSATLNVRSGTAQLTKTLTNLVANSMDAIRGPGRVKVTTANRYLEHPCIGYETIPPGEYVVLGVADTGEGISDTDLGRVFDPFFTKKILGRSGTGLGLTVVWHTVKGSDGFIDLSSGPTGSDFELYFPASREPAEGNPAMAPLNALLGNGERILVVDDEALQREIAAELLVRLGYQVTVVASGEEAVSLVKREAFDLVVLDMIMSPGMGGRETYEAMLRARPGQKAIIASGYAETDDIRRTLALGAGQAVLKPYTIQRFGRAVRDELHQTASRHISPD